MLREERIISPSKGLSSPAETFASFHSLWFDRALTRNLLTTLRRLALGFGLAALVGVPLGVLCGCFPRVQAFFMPMTLVRPQHPRRRTDSADLFALRHRRAAKGDVHLHRLRRVRHLGHDACHQEVGGQYIDTAYTLGAGTWQTIGKVLLPLALPSVFNSLRLIFGLAFGYIMLAEVVKFGGETGGLGDLINISQRRGPREHVLLILLIIPVVALVIDRFFFFVQAELFPYRYGGMGLLNRLVRGVLHAWEDLRLAVLEAVTGLLGQRPEPAPAKPQPMRKHAMSSHRSKSHGSRRACSSRPGGRHRPRARGRSSAGRGAGTACRRVSRRHQDVSTPAAPTNSPRSAMCTFVVEDLVDKGEFICVLGPSGCGKSTILRLIAGLGPQHPPTKGEVLVMGQPVNGPGADRGMVFQDYTSFDHRTVLDNVAFGLECQGVPRRERYEHARRWIARVGLDVAQDDRTSTPTSSPAACASGSRSLAP